MAGGVAPRARAAPKGPEKQDKRAKNTPVAPALHIDAEGCVLGACLIDAGAFPRIAAIVSVRDFECREHRLIYAAIAALVERGQAVDLLTVSDALEKAGELEAAGDLAYIGTLANETPSAANAVTYAEMVRDASRTRRLQEAAGAAASDPSPEKLAALQRATSEFFHVEPPQRLVPVDLSATDLEPVRNAIAPILPRGEATLLASHGGAGKTILAETCVAHLITGTPFAGLPVEPGRVLFVSLEDRAEVVRHRLRKICNAYGLDYGQVVENLVLLDGTVDDSVLAVEGVEAGVRRLQFTSTFDEVERAAEGCVLVVIDNASDAFDGDENSRRQVGAFVRGLVRIARKHDCAVLLLAHVDKAAARHGGGGNSYSGSTAWHNKTRSRLALLEDDEGLRLVHEKLNVGKKIDPIRLEWTEGGVLVPVATTGTAAVERETEDDAAVLAAIDAAIKDGATVHAARSGSHSTLAVLKTYPDLPKALRKDAGRFWAALTRLERAGRVAHETYRNEYRKERVRLSVRASLPHTPYALTRAGGRASAPVLQEKHRRTTDALTQCQHCDGEGCNWCRPTS